MRYYLTLTFALLLAGCGQQTVGNTGDLALSGQIQNWQVSFGATLNAIGGPNEALGSGSVDDKGNFEVTVSPPFYTLGNIEPCQNDTSTIVQNPKALRVSSVRLEIAERKTSFVSRNAARGAPKEAIYVYADQAGTVQGQVECTGRYTNTYRFNLSLIQGWNQVLVSVEVTNESSAIATYTSATSAEVTSYSWYAYVP